MKKSPRFNRNRLSQAVTLACFAIASAPVMAGSGSCPATGANTISTAVVARCGLDFGDTVDITSNGSITVAGNGVYVYGATVNAGLIDVGGMGLYVYTDFTGDIVNSGTIDAGRSGIYVYGTNSNGDIVNSGTIIASDMGVYVYGNVKGDIINTGTIDAHNGIYLYTEAYGNVFGSIINSGLIDANDTGMFVYGAGHSGVITGDFINSGTIDAGNSGIYLYSDLTIGGDFINSGLIDAGGSGIYLYSNTLTIAGDLINSGTILADDVGIYIYAGPGGNLNLAGDLINSGTIMTRGGSSKGISLADGSVIGGSLINSGLIDTRTISDGYDGIYVYNSSIGGDVHNTSTGVINAGEVGIYLYGTSIGGSFINDGTIIGTGGYQGVEITASTISGSIINNGLINTNISGDEGDSGFYIYNTTIFGDVSNTGVIDAEDFGIYLYSGLVAGGVSNTGTITSAKGFGLYIYKTVVVGAITNSGTIGGGIYIYGTAPTFANSGVISSGFQNSYVQDNYSQTADGVFRLDATDAATYGDLTVDGTATFAAGSGLQVGFDAAHTIVAGDVLADVIDAGTLSASSFTVGDNLLSLSWIAVIDGDTVDLTAVSTGLTTITAATIAAGYSGGVGAAGVLDTLIAADPFSEAAFAFGSSSTEQEIANGVESVVPVLSGGLAQASLIIGSPFTDIVGTRQDAENGISSGDEYFVHGNMWLKPFGGFTDQDKRDGVSGYGIDSYGIAVGLDGAIPSSSWSVGAAFAWIKSDVDSDITVGSQNVDVHTYLGKIYASYKLDDVTSINLQGGVGKSNYDSKRVNFTGAVARSDYDSTHYQARAEVVRSYQINTKTSVSPYIHVDYIKVDVDDYVETGAGSFNLTVGADANDSLVLGGGVKSSYAASDNLLLTGKVGVGYDALADSSSLTSSFAGGGAKFSTQGIKPDEIVYNVGVGGKYSVNNVTEVTVRYNFEGRNDYTDQSFGLNLRWNFF